MGNSSLEMIKCYSCSFEAKKDSNKWIIINNPVQGNIKQCPKCNSTNIRKK